MFSAKIINKNAFGANTWVLDTGVTDHIVCSMSLLTTITAIVQYVVELPNGETTKVIHTGTVTLSSQLTLTNVLSVPFFFPFNILSISTITKS